MSKKIIYSCLPFVILLLISGCSKPGYELLLPKDANGVIIINTPGIIQKVAWSSLTSLNVLEDLKLLSDTTTHKSEVGRLLAKADDAGISLSEKIFIFHHTLKSQNYVAALFSLKDKEALEEYLLNQKKTIEKKQEYNITILDTTIMAAWNEKQLLLLGYTDKTNSIEGLKDKLVYLTGLQKDEQLIHNKDFKKTEDDGDDISIWINTVNMKNNGAAQNSSDEFWYSLKGNAFINFNKGVIEARIKQHADTSFSKYSGILNRKLGFHDFSFINGNDIVTMIAGSVNPRKLNSIQPDSIEKRLQQLGSNGAEINSVFKGDFALAFTGMKETQETYVTFEEDDDFNVVKKTITKKKTIPQFTSLFSVNSEKKAIAFLQKASEAKHLQKKTDRIYTLPILEALLGCKTYVFCRHDIIVLTTDSALTFSKEKIYNNLPDEIKVSIISQPVSFYANIARLNTVSFDSNNTANKNIINAREKAAPLFSSLRSVYFSFSELSANEYELKLLFYFNNKEENSLIQLIKIMRAKKNNGVMG